MSHGRKAHFWTVGAITLALVAFLTGTSIACFQKGVDTVRMAEDCCQSHCQHAMIGERAVDCCQRHHAQTAPAFPSSPPVKAFALMAMLPLATLSSFAVLPVPDQPEMWRFLAGHSPPSTPLYTLHCILLI